METQGDMYNDQCKIACEKYWSEIDETEKCRRLRRVVKGLQREVRALTQVVEKLTTHQHVDGSLYVPLFPPNEPSFNTFRLYEKEGDDVFF